ncbi:hypothetical protein [Leisingera sp.]|uniref:hypothetical protein n=1 Tax=Leisingera sp. TaxID=1879318 RepID=UPI002B27B0CE|nr:hypothetical protein [Leisingera sp.]
MEALLWGETGRGTGILAGDFFLGIGWGMVAILLGLLLTGGRIGRWGTAKRPFG